MSVVLNRCAPDEPATTCQGCGTRPATARIETCPDVDTIDPVDVAVCDQCVAELKGSICGGTVTPGQRGGKVGRHHPDQSKRAAAAVDSGTQQAALLRIVATRYEEIGEAVDVGATCAEAAGPLSIMVGHTVSRNQTATRMGELYEKQLVEALLDGDRMPVKRRTSADGEGQVWVCTAAGRTEAARLAT